MRRNTPSSRTRRCSASASPPGLTAWNRAPTTALLALSDDGRHWRCCEVPSAEGDLHLRWSPWDDVEIETWLVPRPPGHLRIHRIVSARRLFTAEGGFALSRDTESGRDCGRGYAWAVSDQGESRIEDDGDTEWPTGVRREGRSCSRTQGPMSWCRARSSPPCGANTTLASSG